MRIIIADDHALIRKGLKEILQQVEGLVLLDEAQNGPELLLKVTENDYDIIVLDISMPGKSGLDVLKDLSNIKPEIPVLILSVYPEEQYAIRVLKAGASGYLTKDSAPDELVSAIKKIVNGGKYISASLAEMLASEVKGGGLIKQLHENLSDREFQVMKMLAIGKTVKEISEELFLSPKTVSTYRTRIYDKMKFASKAELTGYAMKNGLID
ncbi:MAG TPA: response regulator transcription factor [Ignavibacteriaceae bacterium]|nr:response regulator transcription factor [Ignavibacteriaceae bacterium]